MKDIANLYELVGGNIEDVVKGMSDNPRRGIDLREATLLNDIKLLLEKGAKIYAYDPVGEKN